MPVPSDAFRAGDVYINFPQEEVMFRWVKTTQQTFRKFYSASENEIHYTNKLFREAERIGVQITAEEYAKGKPAKAK